MKPYIAIAEKTNNGKPRKDFGIQINFVKFALPLTIFREFCQRR